MISAVAGSWFWAALERSWRVLEMNSLAAWRLVWFDMLFDSLVVWIGEHGLEKVESTLGVMSDPSVLEEY